MLSCVVLVSLLCYHQVYKGGHILQRKVNLHCGVHLAIGLLSWLNIQFLPSGLNVPDCRLHESILRHGESAMAPASSLQYSSLRWLTLPPTILALLVLAALLYGQNQTSTLRVLCRLLQCCSLRVVCLPKATNYDLLARCIVVTFFTVYTIAVEERHLWAMDPWCQSGPKTFGHGHAYRWQSPLLY